MTQAETSAGILDLSRAVAPTLVARSDEIEKHRSLPNDLARSLADQGFYRLWVPKRLGGLELPLVPSFEVIENLAIADPSVAWCVAISVSSSLALSQLSDDIAREVFAGPDTIIAGVYAPKGRADAVDGGFRVSGQWPFGSGTLNADWVLAGSRYFRDDQPILDKWGQPRTNMVLVPSDQVKFLDTWHVSGLSGTGSTDFQLENVLVPEDFVPGWVKRTPREYPIYRIPQIGLLAVGFGAIALGLARAALSDLLALADQKTATGQTQPLAQRRDFQGGLARAEVSLRAARTHYYECTEALWQAALEDRVGVEERASVRLATLHAVEIGAEVAKTAYHLGGASSIYTGSRLQRLFRDSHVITQHVQVRPDLYSVIGSHLSHAPKGTDLL